MRQYPWYLTGNLIFEIHSEKTKNNYEKNFAESPLGIGYLVDECTNRSSYDNERRHEIMAVTEVFGAIG